MFKDENGKFYYGWWIVLLGGILCVFGYSAIVSVVGIFMAAVPAAIGASVGQFSLYLSILSITNIIVLAIVSNFFKKSNIKQIAAIAAFIGALSFLGFSFATQVWHFYLLAIPMGFAFGCVSMTPTMLLISNWFGVKVRGKAMSIFLAIMAGGTSLLMPLLQIIVLGGPDGWRKAYLLLAVALLVCVPLILLIMKWSPAEKGIKRVGDIEDGGTMPDPANIPGVIFKEGLKRPLTWFAFLSATMLVIGSSAILAHGIPTMIQGGYSPMFATTSISIMSFIMIFVGIIIGAITDKVNLSYAAVGTSLFFVVCFIGLAYMNISAPIWFYLYIVGYMVGVPAINLITPLMMGHMFGDKEIGKYIGYSNIFVSIGGVFGAAVTGIIFDLSGGYKIAWLVMASIVVIVAIIRGIACSQRNKFVPPAAPTADQV